VASNSQVKFGSIDRHKALRRSQSGRVCVSDGCSTVLSIYNESATCSVHERLQPRLVARRP